MSLRGRVGRHTRSGGRHCQNWPDDQQTVIALLNRIPVINGGAGGSLDGRIISGMASDALYRAISQFEHKYFPGQRSGFVDPGGAMLKRMEAASAPPPRYYTATVEPSKWTPTSGAREIDPDPRELDPDTATDEVALAVVAKDVVKIDPWRHDVLTIGALHIKGRSAWGAADPTWANVVTYYNVKAYPLNKMLNTIVVHHTANNETIRVNEFREKGRGFAAIGYHFFIEKSGNILEGRPLEVMGSHAGKGFKQGPEFDPDFGAIGIAMQGDYDSVVHSAPPPVQLKSLEDLIVALRVQFPSIRKLLLHNEVVRNAEPTVCPGAKMVEQCNALRKKLGL